VVLLLFTIRLGLPQYIKFALYPAVAFFGIWAMVSFIRSAGWRTIKLAQLGIFVPWILLLLYYAISLAFTPEKQVGLLKDAFNILVLAAFVVSFFLARYTREELARSLQRFGLLTVIFSSLFALAGIVKLVLQLYGVKLAFLNIEGFGYPSGTSLSADDNFFTLLCLLGAVFVLPYAFSRLSKANRVWLQVAAYLLVVNVFLATSRRGLIIGSLFLTGAVLLWVASWMLKKEWLRNFRLNTTLFILFTSLSFLGYYHFVFRTSAFERNEWLANSRFNKEEFNIYLNLLTLNGQSIFKGNAEYAEVSDKIWKTKFDPRYPYTGWASGNYELVKDLHSLKLINVPPDAQGAKVSGNTGVTGKWDGNAFYYSKIMDGKIVRGKRYVASVYCYLSDNFDGSWVRVSASGSLQGITHWYYDLAHKGTWQKLQTSFYADSGSYSVYFYLCRKGDSTLNNLNGYAIFAYPELKTVDFNPAQPLTWMDRQFTAIREMPGRKAELLPKEAVAARFDRNAFYFDKKYSQWVTSSTILRPSYNVDYRYITTIYAYVSDDFDGTGVYLQAGGGSFGFTRSAYNLKNRGTWQRLYLSFGMFEKPTTVSVGVRKDASSPLDSIHGEVLLAYPEMEMLRFDPKNPLTWAGTNFKREFPLRGEHVDIVPKGSVGYRVDRESQLNIYKDFSYSSSAIYKTRLKKGNRYITSVYAYVTPDFDGENVRLSAGGNYLGYRACYYDMERKGQWQKLTINSYGEEGEEYYANLYFEYRKSTDFSQLKGHVVFAYPTYSVVKDNPQNPASYAASDFKREFPLTGENSAIVPDGTTGCRFDSTTQGRVWRNQFHSTTDFQQARVVKGDSVFASVYCLVSPDFNGNDVRLELRGPVKGQTLSRLNLNEHGRWVKLEASAIADKEGVVSGILFFMQSNVKDFSTLKGYVTFAYPQLYVKPKAGLSYMGGYPKISLAGFAGLGLQLGVPADSSGSGGEFKLSMPGDRFAGPRIDRWRYAVYLYRYEYTPLQKFFGGGFGYTRKFAQQFFPDDPKRDYDYPHNPFLSILLYSGLLGLLISIWFIYNAFRLYWHYRKELWPVGIAFLASFFFAFFSCNNFFEPAILGALAIIPFYYDYLATSKES
jgi:hypothetical protein